jgi:TRAP-type C4-dicarboxylate transport system permease small subunit
MSTSLFRIPTWIPETAMPVGFALLVVAMIVRIIVPSEKGIKEEIDESIQQL